MGETLAFKTMVHVGTVAYILTAYIVAKKVGQGMARVHEAWLDKRAARKAYNGGA